MEALAVNPIAAMVIEADHDAAREMGFTFTPRWALGTQAAGKTREGYLRVRSEFERMPMALDGLRSAADIVAREERRDFMTRLRDVAFDHDGTSPIVITPEGDYHIEHDVFSDLAERLPGAPADRFIRGLLTLGEGRMAVDVVNRLLSRAENADREMRIRTRMTPGTSTDAPVRSIYAITSDSYAAYDADRVMADVAAFLASRDLAGARSLIEYDGAAMSARVTWFNYHGAAGADAAGHGDAFRFGIEIGTADDRSAAVKVRLSMFFNGCLNYIIINESTIDLGKLVHSGSVNRMRNGLAKLIGTAWGKAAPLATRWADASKENLCAELGDDPVKLFTALQRRGFGKIPGISEATASGWYLEALRSPAPGQPRWDGGAITKVMAVNAMTQAAHRTRLPGFWTGQTLESQAGALLFARVTA